MWEIQEPKPVKLIMAMMAASPAAMDRARDAVEQTFGGPGPDQSHVGLYPNTILPR